jgi:hypothetical protein
MSRALSNTTLIIAFALAVACGPSIRRTYQSDNGFERCFDMDYNPARSTDEKRGCWSVWLERYVYNQPADKVAYAQLRLVELDDGIAVPGPPGPEGAFDQRPEPTQSAEPPVAETPAVDEPAPTAADAGVVDIPGSACESACKRSYVPCADACADGAGDAGPATGCAAACGAGYKACMRDCFSQ